ncbi:MAG: hypothetical protein GF317_21780 [Candidatus Lokiarchaeota archaeon]|nr:hypothetical protein [Candidatus Lokiarchaeota archaeon]MBD3202092.1 hypothetical protein [Candidatus Lokiarchaeota archaeon]
MSNSNGLIRNLWYLNINSNNGIAIGKCGNLGSNLTDLDITAGLITASQQLSQEMVSNDEVSKYNIEEIKGGSKRLILYSTWGNELTLNQDQTEIPIITSMLQVSGPEMQEYAYNKLLMFLRNLNEEIIYRFMLGELIQERTIDPIIHIDILDRLNKKYMKSKKGLLGGTNNNFSSLLKRKINRIVKHDLNVLNTLLSIIPLKTTLNQKEYIKKIKELKKFVKDQISEFLKIEAILTKIRYEIIYANEDSFSYLKREYNEYLDKQETYFENKRALNVALEQCILNFEDLENTLTPLKNHKDYKQIVNLQKELPKVTNLSEFLERIENDFKKSKKSKILENLESKIFFKESEITKSAIKKNLIKKEESKQYQERLVKLKKNLQTFISISKELVKSNRRDLLEKLKKKYYELLETDINIQNESIQSKFIGSNSLKKSLIEILNEPIVKDQEKINYRKVVRNLLKKQRKNLISKIIDSVFVQLFHSYRHFKYTLSFTGNLKELIIKESIKAANSFIETIQDYSFAVLLDRILSKISSPDLIKYYSILLLRSFLENYLYRNFKQNPFFINEKNPVIALDTYSIRFCSEIIKNTGLNQDIYNIIEKLDLPRSYREEFIQILDSSGESVENVVFELKGSISLFKDWKESIKKRLKDIKVKGRDLNSSQFLRDAESFIKKYENSSDDNIQKGIYFIKERILKNASQKSTEWKEIIKRYQKPSEIQEMINQLESLDEKGKTYFDGVKNYNKLINLGQTLLKNQLERDISTIDEIINNLDYVVDTQKVEKIENLLSKVDNVNKLFDDKAELTKFKNKLNQIVKYEKIENIYECLNSLDNGLLKLKQFTHIKGLVKTALSKEPVFKESDIEYKFKAYDLLLEALVNTYAHIYEDYFGKFTFKDTKKFLSSDLEVTISPGRMFNKQYNIAKHRFYFLNGLNLLDQVFELLKKYENKFDYIDLEFLLNYLVDYKKYKGFQDPESFIEYFHSEIHLKDFFDYIIEKLCSNTAIKELKSNTNEFYESLRAYIMDGAQTKPQIPKELKLFGNGVAHILVTITENVSKDQITYFYDGSHPDKHHLSRDFNLKEVPPKEIKSFLEDLDEFEENFKDDVNYLFKKLSFEPKKIKSLTKILEEAKLGLKEVIKKEIEKTSLSEYDFEDINKTRIMALLNTTEYELPLDIKMHLINAGRYNKETVKKLTKISTKISDLFKLIIQQALIKDPELKRLFNIKLNNESEDKIVLPCDINVPKEISEDNRKKIFGQNAIWENEHHLCGFKLPFLESNKETFGQAIKSKLNQEISLELKPIISLLNQYSREIHTGFEKVYQKIFE